VFLCLFLCGAAGVWADSRSAPPTSNAQLVARGHFIWEQAQVSPGIWELTLLSVNLKGRILVVKHLDVQMKETRQSFKRIPSPMAAEQAISMLLKGGPPLQASAK
jgi:hypothetical protein